MAESCPRPDLPWRPRIREDHPPQLQSIPDLEQVIEERRHTLQIAATMSDTAIHSDIKRELAGFSSKASSSGTGWLDFQSETVVPPEATPQTADDLI
ncbi:hypothetical protein NDU88_002570 [Pleurodeles waltl]|uniref:Uncharacterized protein n=1 Tax=Pleurodeles waltl TaxID=8319 RepID=A0AAV7TMB8_PLEWA|nr:hypothetical protein NDU88_002570 [Pleurodeles waltl]